MSDTAEAAIDMDEIVVDDGDHNPTPEIKISSSPPRRKASISRLSIRSANLELRGRRRSSHHILTDKRSAVSRRQQQQQYQNLRRLQRATTQTQIVQQQQRRRRPSACVKTVSSASIDNDNGEVSIKTTNEELAKSLELLQLVDEVDNPDAVGNRASLIDQSSGDFSFNDDATEEAIGACAAAAATVSRPRSVQWKGDVDVIYYAGDRRGGKLIKRENEPLREESDQQARKNRYVQLALAKSLFSKVSATCHLRDSWLAALPK